jgi:hypothetical protein
MKDTSLGIHARRIGSRWPRIFRSEGRKSTFYIAKGLRTNKYAVCGQTIPTEIAAFLA